MDAAVHDFLGSSFETASRLRLTLPEIVAHAIASISVPSGGNSTMTPSEIRYVGDLFVAVARVLPLYPHVRNSGRQRRSL